MSAYVSLVQVVCWIALAFSPPATAPSGDPQRETTRSPHGALNIPCENCHTAAGWRPIKNVLEFEHNKTKYPLRGMHEKVQCTQCHVKPAFTDVGKNCQDCHTDVHQRKMGTDCASCHTVLGWNIATQQIKDHQNRFPLFGAHAAVPCEECHRGAAVGQFQGLSTDCISCHLKDFQSTTNPNHAAANFSTTCNTCHSADSWLGAKFDHSTTGFLLTNGHANVPCASCHINNNYNLQIAPTDCGNSGCHLTTWQQTNNPVHSTSGAPFAAANCSTCHNTVSWTTATFNHSTTGFTLIGTHMSPTPTLCISCHVNNNYTLSSTDCMGCHLAAWNSTPSFGGNVPNHITAGFPTTAAACATCHTITAWSDGKFDHSTTGFALTNGHANVVCAACHINGNYNLKIAPTDCGNSGCHLTTWQQTNNPVHSTSGAPFAAANCSTCHNTVSWTTATFDHSTTGFTLTGTHVSPTPTPCTSCHVNNNYTLNSTDCMGCHLAAWNSTPTYGGSVPDHIKAGFPTTAAACATCHPITVWSDGKFDHSATGLTLVGTHMSPTPTPCTSCHVSGNYTLNSTDCMGCHLAAWNSTPTYGGNVPDHIKSGFPSTAAACATCHPITVWTDGKFDHSTTGWSLQGMHTTTPCISCHINSNYSLTSANTDCYGCHTAAWQSTQTMGGNVPNHIAAQYPTTCVTCHTTWVTTNWLGATFNHTYFRIPHNGSVCSDCHIVPTNYATFSCINCHTRPTAHQPGMQHPRVSGYVYGATTCYNCHK